MLNKSYSLAAIIAVSGFAMAGCETTDRLHISDDYAPQIAGAVVIRPTDWRFGKNDRIQGGLEIGYERQLTDNLQRLDSGHQIVIQNSSNDILVDNTFSGPQIVRHSARFEHGHLMYKLLLNFGQHFQLEPGFGLSYDQITVTTTGQRTYPIAGPASVETVIEPWSATVGVTPRFKFNEVIAVEAPARLSRTRLSDGLPRDSGSLGVALVMTPIKQLEISGGYVWRDQEIETPIFSSNIHVETGGPMIALRFVF